MNIIQTCIIQWLLVVYNVNVIPFCVQTNIINKQHLEVEVAQHKEMCASEMHQNTITQMYTALGTLLNVSRHL